MANGIRGFRNSRSARMDRAETPIAFPHRPIGNRDSITFQCSHIAKRFDHQTHDDMNELRAMVRFNIHVENNPTNVDREAKGGNHG